MRCRIERMHAASIVLVVAGMTACTGRSLVDAGESGEANDDRASVPETGFDDDADDSNDDAGDQGGGFPTTGPDDGPPAPDDGGFEDVTTYSDDPCAAVLAESRHCAVLGFDAIVHVVGLDSGDACELVHAQWPADTGKVPLGLDLEVVEHQRLDGLAWTGDAFYTCAGTLAQIDASGVVTASDVACEWVSQEDGVLTVYSGTTGQPVVREYAGWPEVLAHDATTTHSVAHMLASRFLAADGVLYGAWHSTDRLLRLALDSDEPQPDLVLAGFDDWVDGIDIAGGELLVASHTTLLRFDPATGEPLGQVVLAASPTGGAIDCRTP